VSGFVGNIVGIKNGLLSLLQGVQYDAGSGAEAAFGLVTDDPSQEFQDEPYCLLLPGDFMDEQVVVGANDYTIPFVVLIMLSLENGQRRQPATYDYMYKLVELTLNTLDTADFTDALNTTTGLNTYIMQTSKARVAPGETKGGAVLLARIDVSIRYQFNL
jgi:hypothetical protein